jgi:hypothetical protein
MKLKFVIAVLILLITCQLLLLCRGYRADIELLVNETNTLQLSTRQMLLKEKRLRAEIGRYREIIATIPPSVLMGFEDPEAVFAQFLDFLHADVMAAIATKVVLRRQLQFVQNPVPLRVSDFSFRFNFNRVAEAENFFDYLLLQSIYPLKVNRLKLSGGQGGSDRVVGELFLSLMIPDKLILASDAVVEVR